MTGSLPLKVNVAISVTSRHLSSDGQRHALAPVGGRIAESGVAGFRSPLPDSRCYHGVCLENYSLAAVTVTPPTGCVSNRRAA